MDIDKFLETLDLMIDDQSVVHHPFYQALSEGELSRDDLAIFAWAYYPHVKAFPSFLELSLRHLTPIQKIREILMENLREELAIPAPHTELWITFAQALGLDRSEIENAQILPEVSRSIELFSQICRRDLPSALTALYCYERQQPELADVNLQSLREFYNIHSEQALAYFSVHRELDIEHREESRLALQLCLEKLPSPPEPALLFSTAQKALDSQWILMNGICRWAGLSL